MTLKDIQKDIDDFVNQFKVGYYPPLSIITQAIEELGELAREVNNRYGPRVKKSPEDTSDIGEEIVDVMFALVCLANSQNIDLSESWNKKIGKINERDKNRWERK